jgi:DNA-directed RNA polymerase subunit RPC12/RpoP
MKDSLIEGYFLMDHRGSPGVEAEVVMAQGLPPSAGQGLFESKAYTCGHCEAQVLPNPERAGVGRPRYNCKTCSHYICDNCAALAATGKVCYPLKARVKDYLEAIDKGTSPETAQSIHLLS